MSEVLPEMASLGRSATDESVEPGLITVGLMKDPNKMQFKPLMSAGSPRNSHFTLRVSATSNSALLRLIAR